MSMSSARSHKICPSRDARHLALFEGFVFIEAMFGTELLSPKTAANKTEGAVTGVTAVFACVRWSARNATRHGLCLFDKARRILYSTPLD
jgi:hypothetical protein